jgi:hypothetical protein
MICTLPCLTCTGPTSCLTLYSCRSGEYRGSGNLCIPCKYPCLTC